MATLNALKEALNQAVKPVSFQGKPLSDEQYSAGLDVLLQGSGRFTYRDFIIPQLSRLLAPFATSHDRVWY